MDNLEDPALGYLEQEIGMPIINNLPALASMEDEEFHNEDLDEDLDEDLEDELAADLDEEFGEIGSEDPSLAIESDTDDMDEFGTPEEDELDAEFEEDEMEEEVADFEASPVTNDDVPLLDADEVPEQDDTEVQFATVANVVHVIRSNRIVASIGPSSARRAGVADVYQSQQFQDVVAHNISEKGIRKGLVQSGFILAKVKLTSSKVASKVVNAKVAASMNKRIEAMAKKERAMEQCLAIAAVGINRQFFKDAKNELKANLETELVQAGVRGGARIVRAMFAQYGVSYAHSILALANKLTAMPEVVRDQYAEALDMTSEGDFEEPEELESDFEDDEGMEEFDPIPASVTAAVHNPIRKDVGLLLAGAKSTKALAILSGKAQLI